MFFDKKGVIFYKKYARTCVYEKEFVSLQPQKL